MVSKAAKRREIVQDHRIKARTGKAFAVKKGDLIRLIDIDGQQPIDFWAFKKQGTALVEPCEFLSCEHTKTTIEKLFPERGDAAYTNLRRPIVAVLGGSSVDQHDMQYAACDPIRYKLLGFKGKHANCQDNLHKSLRTIGAKLSFTPQPWNIFANFIVNKDRTITIKTPTTKAGDDILLRAEMDAWIVVSACPQDMNDTCGGKPTDIGVEVLR